ncbi:MAG TPA: ABC transporter permease [Vicinamibacterales bacterium]|nr:ABC transporter permease [Vicinamibacterales bacterium]
MAVPASLVLRRAELPTFRRAIRMYQRNLLVYKHSWRVIFSGFFEPLFYLLSIGLGLGGMLPDVDGVNYTAFVAPGLLASSCMNGAISDGMFNIWFKLHLQRTYDGILATPMRVADVAFGEMLWALTRGSIYAAVFLALVLALGELRGPRILLSATALLALPASVVVAAALSSMAICLCSFVRKREDFDVVMGVLVMPMFLFSGVFFPLSQLPPPVRLLFELMPLSHAVALLRGLTTGTAGVAAVGHCAYLAVTGTVAFAVAMRRLEHTLIK